VEAECQALQLEFTVQSHAPDPSTLAAVQDVYAAHAQVTAEQKKGIDVLSCLGEVHDPFLVQIYDPHGLCRDSWTPRRHSPVQVDLEPFRAVSKQGMAGQWTLRLLVFPAVVSYVDYVLNIEVKFSELSSVLYQEPFTLDRLRMEWLPAEETEPRWRIGQLHEHSNRSSGLLSPEQTIAAYQDLGYHFLALTDLDQAPLQSLREKPGLSLIRGQEVHTWQGHYLLLGTGDAIPWLEEKNVRDLSFLVQDTHAQGGLFCVLHPYALGWSDGWDVPRFVGDRWSRVDLLEVWPGLWKNRFPEILKTLDLWDTLLNRGWRVFGVCGKGYAGELTDAYIQQLPKLLVMSESLYEDDLLAALKMGHSYMTLEPAVGFWAESQVGGAMMGDELRLSISAPYLLRITVSQMERCFIRIKSNTGILCEMPLPSTRDADLKFTLRALPQIQWFRLEIYRYGRPLDTLVALTNPLFVRGMVSI
jgi:hypothetical protein